MPDRGLVVCSTFSLPPTSGGRKRALRLLEAMERARADGVDVDEAVMASVAPPSSSTPTKKG